MARSEDDRTQNDSFDAGSPPADAPPAIPGTEPHTTPALTTQDRRTVDAGPAAGSPAHDVVYDDRKQRAVDPHADSPPADEGHPIKDAADQVRQAVEPRTSPTGTMGASGEHARLPERD